MADNGDYKILLVEDDPTLRKMYSVVMESEGFEIDTAVDGQEALEKASKGGYDLVLLDLMLPKVDGMQILQTLKQKPPETPNKKIVVLTNLGQDSVLRKLDDYDVPEYLVKSDMTPGEFVEEVKRLLEDEGERG